MALDDIFGIAGSSMTAQSQRLNVVSSNLANAESTTGPDGKPYRAKHVVFSPVTVADQEPGRTDATGEGVQVTAVIEDNAPFKRIYQPGNPTADAEGYVSLPNVNMVDQMVDMISASRAYQNSVEMMNSAKSLLLKTLTLGQ